MVHMYSMSNPLELDMGFGDEDGRYIFQGNTCLEDMEETDEVSYEESSLNLFTCFCRSRVFPDLQAANLTGKETYHVDMLLQQTGVTNIS